MLFSVILTQCALKALHCCDTNCTEHNQSLQAYHDAIISCCITSGTESIPLKGGSQASKSGPGRVPGWTEQLRSANSVLFFGTGCER